MFEKNKYTENSLVVINLNERQATSTPIIVLEGDDLKTCQADIVHITHLKLIPMRTDY